MNGMTALRAGRGRYGMNELRGAHVTMPWNGSTLIGEVTGQRVETAPGGTYTVRLDVRYMCGDPWPLSPSPASVNVLKRDYSEEADS